MAKYMFLLRGAGDWPSMSPSELQEAMHQYISWSQGLGSQNAGADELDDACRVVGPKPKMLVTEGPFAETREAVGGYFIVQSPCFDDAVELAKTCPHVSFGGSVEVRPIIEDPMASLMERISQ